MSGLALVGRWKLRTSPADALDHVSAFLSEQRGEEILSSTRTQSQDGLDALYVTLHPAAKAMEFRAAPDGRLFVETNTLAAGPGYHCDCCFLLKQFADERGLQWDPRDEKAGTGDFFRFFDGLLGQAMLQNYMLENVHRQLKWFQTNRYGTPSFTFAQLFVPKSPFFHVTGGIATAMGPRNDHWIQRVLNGDADAARDVFPWWTPQRDAAYYVRRALHQMWVNVHWRKPLLHSERTVLEDVDRCLANSYRLNPNAALPIYEWREVRRYLGISNPMPAGPQNERRRGVQALIGYLRDDVTLRPEISQWGIIVPGSLAIEYPDTETVRAFDAELDASFRFKFMRQSRDDLPFLAALLEGQRQNARVVESFAHERGQMKGMAELIQLQETENLPWRLIGVHQVDREFCQCSISFARQEQLARAIRIWHSVRFPRTDGNEPEN